MEGKTRKIVLIGFALIALVSLASICSDIFLVIATMSVLTNLLVFAELGHKFWEEIFDDDDTDAREDQPTDNQDQIDKSSVYDRVNAIVSDTYPDTYIPARNVGHIGYYEDPLLEPDELFPKYYGDVDDASVAYEKRRIRDEQSIDGAVNKTPDHYKINYRSEFVDTESRDWYGNYDL
jgi:hypothetical protein